MRNNYWTYIITNSKNTTFYIGVTNNLERRVYEHKHHLVSGFSSRYNLHKLVYCEPHTDVDSAITREKQLKNWHRKWKIELIMKENPKMIDLSKEWLTNELDSGSSPE